MTSGSVASPRRTRRALYTWIAIPVAAGAPLGWLLLSLALYGDRQHLVTWTVHELAAHVPLYAYLSISTTIVLAFLGAVLGSMTDRLERDALTDVLTGLHNRRYLEARLVEEMARARRYGTTLSLILIDVDDFKAINDRFGHDFGDSVLKRVARQIRASARGSDIAARPAGDEFVVLLPQTDSSAALVFSERLLASMTGKLDGSTLSIGVGVYRPELHASPREFFHDVDQALYAAKQAGKNRVEVMR